MSEVSNNKRIAINTFLLYIRMLFTMGISLYTVPIVLHALGASDYGLYNVVGGIVALFSFVGSSMASGSQRFIAYAIGKGDYVELCKVFNSTVSLYLIGAIVMLCLFEVGGVWFLNNKMVIPEERLRVANWVFQLSLLSFFFNFMSIPYNAAIIAHEKMSAFAYISVMDCMLKLLIAFTLTYVVFDKLLVYTVLMCLVSIGTRLVYQVYCVRNIAECRKTKFGIDKTIGMELIKYSGWNTIGSVAYVFRAQLTNIIMNLFFGTLLNAAHAIATQINGLIGQFIQNVYMASRPQVTKLYASGNYSDMNKLVFVSAKLAFFLLSLIAVPVLVELDSLLSLWLAEYPNYTVEITKILLLALLVETLVNQVISVIQAANRIKNYQIYGSTVLLLQCPIAYLLLNIDSTHLLTPYYVSFILSVVYIIIILLIAKKDVGFPSLLYVKQVVLKDVLVFLVSFICTIGIFDFIKDYAMHMVICIPLSIVVQLIFICFLGLNSDERNYAKKLLLKKLVHKKNE